MENKKRFEKSKDKLQNNEQQQQLLLGSVS